MNYFVGHPLLFLLLLAIISVLLFFYYSETRIAGLMERFDEKTKWERMFWCAVAIVSLILPWVLFAVTLNGMNK